MNLRGFVSWLLCCALLVAATWACLRVGRAFQAVEQQVRWREDNPLFPCEKSPLNVGNARQLVAAARAELALREPEMIVEISESGKIISTIQRLTTESEGLRAGYYAIREIPDAPKKVAFYRRPKRRGHKHGKPCLCGGCGEGIGNVTTCPYCNAAGVVRDLPGAEE